MKQPLKKLRLDKSTVILLDKAGEQKVNAGVAAATQPRISCLLPCQYTRVPCPGATFIC
jgi:hypothetical protein